MKILVPIKRVVDFNVHVRVKADETGMELENVKMAINPFCEIAVEEAIRLKEKGTAEEVIVVSVGPEAAQEQLRLALALGADRAIHVVSNQTLSSFTIAKILQKIVESETPQIILLGKQAIDSDNNQVGQMLAALCNYPQGTFASEIKLVNDQIEVTRETDEGHQTLRLKLPAVITTDLRLNEPRHASLPNIMKAKRKPLTVTTPEELGVEVTSQLTTLKVEAPPARPAGVIVKSVDELIGKLKNEVKVL